MRYSKLTILIPCALFLSTRTTATPACKDNGTCSGLCVEEGPNNVVRQFYDYRTLYHSNDITALHLYLSGKPAILLNDASRDSNHRELPTNDPLLSRTILLGSTRVASVPTIPNCDARSIPLRVDLEQGDQN